MSDVTNSTSSTPPSRRDGRSKAATAPAAETLGHLLARVGILEWDALIVSDGSGSGWKTGAGWASTMVDRLTRERWQFFGGMNMGSVNLAELMPIVHALTWYHANVGRARVPELGRPLRVHVISDSSVIVAQGTSVADLNQPLPHHQEPEWAAVRQLARMGYQLVYHHEPRSTTVLNWAADLLAGLSRKVLQVERTELTDQQWADIVEGERYARQVFRDAYQSKQPDFHEGLRRTLIALQRLMEAHSSPANRAARLIETVGITDPQTGANIDVRDLNPD